MKIVKISDSISHNKISKQSPSKKTDDFNKLLQRKANESKRNFDTYQISSENIQRTNSSQPNLRQSGDVRAITILEDPISQLKNLSHEQKSRLNEKYDLSKMKWGSDEYNSLTSELYKMGVLSNLPNDAFLNVISVNKDDGGNIISYITKADDINGDTDLLDWFSQSINLNHKKYKDILKYGVSSLEDKMFVKQYDSYKTIKTILFDLLQN